MDQVKIAWYGIHEGEEPPLCPAGGIFFSGCNLRCVFCQNYQISQQGVGKMYSVEELADIMLHLQKQGARNIDLVTPTLWYKQIKEAIILARERGLTLPLVWNSNGYESQEILQEMEGYIDIYLPDFKYSDDTLAYRYSGRENYCTTATQAIEEMLRQVGNFDEQQMRGVIIRHMVLPNNLENSFGVLQKIASIDKNIHVSLMNQYFPMHNAGKYEELTRIVTEDEFEKVYQYLLDLGIENGWVQGEKSQENLIPDFLKENPFESH
ncbi:MAG: radical SAM protein [Candidatus Magasanikbacteria bacterium]